MMRPKKPMQKLIIVVVSIFRFLALMILMLHSVELLELPANPNL